MINSQITDAARLVHKALNVRLVTSQDSEYKHLLEIYRSSPEFQKLVAEIASGLMLEILDVTERSLIIAPSTPESKFSVRLSDLKLSLKPDDKAALILAHIAIASVFFPTMDHLERNISPPPSKLSDFRSKLIAVASQLKMLHQASNEDFAEFNLGWQKVLSIPEALPKHTRAGTTSVEAIVKSALVTMDEAGLITIIKSDFEAEGAVRQYTPTQRFRVQLKEIALIRLLEVAQLCRSSEAK